jgi:hypothetical protein
VLKLPLVFPGPVLQDTAAFELKVTLATIRTHQNTPTAAEYSVNSQRPCLIDAGVNLFDSEFSKDVDAVIEAAAASGVPQLLSISTTLDTALYNLQLTRKYPRSIYTMVTPDML